MRSWMIAGLAAASLLAGTAYACPETAHTNRHSAQAEKVAQQKTADPKPDSRYWDPFRPHTGKVWRQQESQNVFARYPWAAVSPLEDKK